MLDGDSPLWLHALQNVALVALSLAFLPLDTLILSVAWCINGRGTQHSQRVFRREGMRTILVTGVGMTKGLVLARLFAAAGHKVIGADASPLACGRYSNQLAAFRLLKKPTSEAGASTYVQSLLAIVQQEQVDLWVSCSGVASAIEDGLAKEVIERATNCKAIQYDVETTRRLHEKSSFMEHIESLDLLIPETRTVMDTDSIEAVLFRSESQDRKYICKCVGMNDASRGDMRLLPLSSRKETTAYLAQYDISRENPWILQHFIEGNEYCTHALVVRGQVRAFVACPSSELLMHYVALPSHSDLSRAMLEFTRTVAQRGGNAFTGHLSFDFLVPNADSSDPHSLTLYPIECNPRAHTAVALFAGQLDLVDGYLDLLDNGEKSTSSNAALVQPRAPSQYFWASHDLVHYFLLPLVTWFAGRQKFEDVCSGMSIFVDHVLHWDDGTFKSTDPLPWWWLHHVYWPAQFLEALLTGRKWSRINVSTTKMFIC